LPKGWRRRRRFEDVVEDWVDRVNRGEIGNVSTRTKALGIKLAAT